MDVGCFEKLRCVEQHGMDAALTRKATLCPNHETRELNIIQFEKLMCVGQHGMDATLTRKVT